MSISLCDGNGKFPLLDIIASYTNNKYSLYLAFGINIKSTENFTEEEVVAKVENNDFKYIKHLDLLLLCCRKGNTNAILNLKKNGMIDIRQMQHCSLCSEVLLIHASIVHYS